MTKAKSKVLEEEEEEDTTWSMKVASRGSGTASLTRLLVVMLMTLMMLMMFYLVYLHVRLNKLEQCQCIAETTRNSIVTGAMGQVDDDVDDYNDVIGKANVRMLSWWIPSSSTASSASVAETVRASRVRRSPEAGSRRQRNGRRIRTMVDPVTTSNRRVREREDVACHLQFHLRFQPNELRLIEYGGRVDLSNGVYDPGVGFRPTRGRVEDPLVYKNWKVQHWAENSRLFRYNHRSGRLSVEKSGIYYIYAQVLYHNAAARSSFTVMIDDEVFLQCWTSVDAVSADTNTTLADNARYKTCFTAGTARLHGHQQIWINDLYGHHVSTNTNSSFFGVFKLSP